MAYRHAVDPVMQHNLMERHHDRNGTSDPGNLRTSVSARPGTRTGPPGRRVAMGHGAVFLRFQGSEAAGPASAQDPNCSTAWRHGSPETVNTPAKGPSISRIRNIAVPTDSAQAANALMTVRLLGESMP